MNGLEDQLRAYGSQLESAADSHEATSPLLLNTSATETQREITRRRRRRMFLPITAAAAGIAVLISTLSGSASHNVQRVKIADDPVAQDTKHYLPTYVPEGYRLYVTTNLPGESTKHVLVFGRVDEKGVIQDSVIVWHNIDVRASAEYLFDTYANPFKFRREMVGDRTAVTMDQISTVDGSIADESTASSSPTPTRFLAFAMIPGCGTVNVDTDGASSAQIAALANVDCVNGTLVGSPKGDLKLLYDANQQLRSDNVVMISDPNGQRAYLYQTHPLAKPLNELLRRIPSRSTVPKQYIASDGDRIYMWPSPRVDRESSWIAQGWVIDQPELAPSMSAEAEKIMNSIREVTDAEWDAVEKLGVGVVPPILSDEEGSAGSTADTESPDTTVA